MKGIDSIKEKITAQAQAKADEIMAQARSQAEAVTAEAEKQAAREAAAIKERGEKQAQEAYKRILSAAALQQRKAVLATKQEVLEEAFSSAFDQLRELSGSDYEAMLVRYIVENAAGGEELVFGSLDREAAPRVAEKAAAEMKAKGADTGFTVSDEAASFGKGVLLRRGELEINCSLAAIAQSMKDSLSSEVAKVLFE